MKSPRFVKVKNRVYEELDDGRQRLKSHSEWALVSERRVEFRFISHRRGWIAITPTQTSSFGMPISPMNITHLRELKVWALGYLNEHGSSSEEVSCKDAI